MLVLVSTTYMHISFCFIVSVNRPIGKIQIYPLQPLDNLAYCNSLKQGDTKELELLKNQIKLKKSKKKKLLTEIEPLLLAF